MSKKFEDLSDFIRNQIRMSHIYQPVMLIELLNNRGSVDISDIAKALLTRDISQVEYYEHITKNRGITERNKDTYHLKGFYDLSPGEIEELIDLCTSKIEGYVEQ